MSLPSAAPEPPARGAVLRRPLANPLPLGYLALGCATLLLAGLQLEWLAPGDGHTVALALIAFVGPAQLLASLVAFAAGDAPAATAMGVLAGTWTSVGLVTLNGVPGATDDALGMVLLAAAAALVVPVATALHGRNPVPATVLSVTSLRLGSSGVYQLTGMQGWARVAGWIGVALAAVALGAALLLSLEHGLDQVETVETTPGT